MINSSIITFFFFPLIPFKAKVQAWTFALNGMRGKKKKVIIEEFINFDYEITLLTILDTKGKIHFCPPIGHVQERGDYQHSWQPAKCEQKIVNKMKIIAIIFILLTIFCSHFAGCQLCW